MSKTWRSNQTRDLTLSTMFEYPEFIFFDTETTGFSAQKEYIIELAAIKYAMTSGVQLEETGRLHLYFKPPFAISEKISELTGITNEFLADKPTFEDRFSEILDFFGASPVVLAWNEPFDTRFMSSSYERAAPNGEQQFQPSVRLDVLEMARDRVNKEDTQNYKLATVAALFGLEDAQFHSAIEDVRVTKRLFDIFFKEYLDDSLTSSTTSKTRPHISSLSSYEGFKGLNRIYVNTDSGTVFYDLRTKTWGEKDTDMDLLDMEYIEKTAWNLTGSTCQKEFEKFKGKVTA